MKQFGLFTKSSKESIHKITALSIDEAVRMFSELKNLEPKVLLGIFDVRESE